MGNQIVSPSMGNWYTTFLRKFNITLKGMIESGTFLLTMDCVDETNYPVIVKAYEYSSPLENMTIVSNCRIFFDTLEKSDAISKGIVSYSQVHVSGNYAFLVRDKFEYSLSQRMQEYPPLEDIEKQWIAYRVLTSILSLHEIELVHGAINPDNIFVTLGLDVCVGDLAPFKPSHIRSDMPHLFYHYYATAGRSYCYLAPEQLLSQSDQTNLLLYNRGTFSMDLFSVGCVLYYLYTGQHLFTFSDLVSFRDETLSIRAKLDQLPLYIQPLINGLLSRQPERRGSSVQNLNRYFPSSFGQISNQFLEFFHGETRLDHLLRLVPAFEVIVESAPEDLRLLFVNAFCQFLIRGNQVQEMTAFASVLVNFSISLSDTVKLNRVLPYFCRLLEFSSDVLKSVGLRCINDLIKSITSLPMGFEALFSAYLIPVIVRSSDDASSSYKSTVASICPHLAYEIHRLAPELMKETPQMFSFVVQEKDSRILNAFINSMREIAQYGCKRTIDDKITRARGNTIDHKRIRDVASQALFPEMISERIDSDCGSEEVEDVQASDDKEKTETSDSRLGLLQKFPSDSKMNESMGFARVPRARSRSFMAGVGAKLEPETKPGNPTEVHCSFSCFIHYFPLLMSALNSSDVAFRVNVLSLLKMFYDNSKLCDRRSYRMLFLDVFPMVLGFLHVENFEAMRSGYLSFLLWCLERRLIHAAHLPQTVYIVSGLRQSNDPSVRYLCQKILRCIPKDADIEKLPSFVVQIMTKVTPQTERTVSKRPGSYGVSSPLVTRKGFAIDPVFYSGQRIGCNEVAFITSHHYKDLIGVVADVTGGIFSVKNDFTVEKITSCPRTITSLCEMRFSHGTAITDVSDRISFIDWEKQKLLTTRVRFDSKIVAMTSKGHNFLYCLSESGTLHYFDSRVCKSVNSLAFDKRLHGLSICAWNDCITIGIGFEESLVQLVDTRMMLPIKAIITERPNQIFPVARNACNFVIAAPKSILCYDAFLGDLEMTMSIANPVITDFDAGIVCINTERTSFIDCEHFEGSLSLFDQKQYATMETSQRSPWVMDPPPLDGCSLHHHVSRVTALTNFENTFISGDETGFVNFWSIGRLHQ